ncbi:MAG: hypothetical protein BZY80_01225 [SAR202 cluster bacterium Io17-Chloro-G2]|nr:MAG: hypothetical protein BZY80_01225 [SAR202 cluster bacterium Io17-Chloro-G2]
MFNLPVYTNLATFVGLLFGALAIGIVLAAGAAWLLARRKNRPLPDIDTGEKEVLYLMFSRLSHRLKAVGEVVRGHLRGFSEDLPKDAERWRVARRAISEEVSEVDGLIQRLDLMVRLGMTGQPLVMEPVNVPALLEDLLVEFAPAADAKGISLGGTVRNPGQDVQTISADQQALKEVFANLLENAVKHNGPGTEVTAQVGQQHGQVTVRIGDNGNGVPTDVLTTLFERGNRSYSPGTARGTGMGLYLCKMLVELHGGRIEALSPQGAGTEFIITLPPRRSG